MVFHELIDRTAVHNKLWHFPQHKILEVTLRKSVRLFPVENMQFFSYSTCSILCHTIVSTCQVLQVCYDCLDSKPLGAKNTPFKGNCGLCREVLNNGSSDHRQLTSKLPISHCASLKRQRNKLWTSQRSLHMSVSIAIATNVIIIDVNIFALKLPKNNNAQIIYESNPLISLGKRDIVT